MPSSAWRVHATLATVALFFGLSYYWTKELVQALPDPAWPLAWCAVRVTTSAALLAGIALVLGRWRLPRATVLKLAGLAVFGVVLNQICFIVGMRHTTPTQSALINLAIPVATLAFSRILGHERLGWRKVVGIGLALSGVASLLLPRAAGEVPHWKGNALTFVNAISFAVFLTLSRPLMRGKGSATDPIAATAWVFLFGTLGIDAVGFGSLRSAQERSFRVSRATISARP